MSICEIKSWNVPVTVVHGAISWQMSSLSALIALNIICLTDSLLAGTLTLTACLDPWPCNTNAHTPSTNCPLNNSHYQTSALKAFMQWIIVTNTVVWNALENKLFKVMNLNKRICIIITIKNTPSKALSCYNNLGSVQQCFLYTWSYTYHQWNLYNCMVTPIQWCYYLIVSLFMKSDELLIINKQANCVEGNC